MSGPAARDAGAGPLIFLVAGEPSGDQLGAHIMAALRAETGGRVRFAGIGGQRMTDEGLDSLFPIDDLAVMGLVEVLPVVFKVYRRVKAAVAAVLRLRPDAVVTIDSPNFTLEISKRLKGRIDAPLVHVVAPSVWAWKPGRARKMAGYLDHLLALLPFEPPYFERHGLATTVIGHPVVEAASGARDPEAFRARHGIPAEAPLICVLPGSRRGEVSRIEPAMAGALALLKAKLPGLHALVPTVPTVSELVRARCAAWPVPATLLEGPGERLEAFAAARAAIAASGTVAVELAVAEVPTVVVYRVAPISALLAHFLLKVDHVSIVNLLLDRAVQPELLQFNCRPEPIARTLEPLMMDETLRAAHLADCREATAMLGRGGDPPSRRAARAILALV